MAYELLSQSRKLHKRGGPNNRGEGGTFFGKKSLLFTLFTSAKLLKDQFKPLLRLSEAGTAGARRGSWSLAPPVLKEYEECPF